MSHSTSNRVPQPNDPGAYDRKDYEDMIAEIQSEPEEHEHDEHGHGHDKGHGHHRVGPRSLTEAKRLNEVIQAAAFRSREGLRGGYTVYNIEELLDSGDGQGFANSFTSDKTKARVVKCGQELSRYRYCEDNYDVHSADPSVSIFEASFPCGEEQWQASECLLDLEPGELTPTAGESLGVSGLSDYIRLMSSRIQIPVEWTDVIQGCDPNGLTDPNPKNPFKLEGNAATRQALNCISKQIFPQATLSYAQCQRSGSEDTEECETAKSELAQSLVALQTSRLNVQNDPEKYALFHDNDSQKGSRIHLWKKANLIGGDPAMRKTEVHPGDHWVSLLPSVRSRSRYDVIHDVVDSLREAAERDRVEDDE